MTLKKQLMNLTEDVVSEVYVKKVKENVMKESDRLDNRSVLEVLKKSNFYLEKF